MSNQSTGWLFKLAPLLLLYAMQLHAADQNSFNDGMKSFKSGDYRAAVEAFEQARQ